MTDQLSVGLVERMTELFEKHGVYAILVVVIFFIWYSVFKRLEKTTSPELRRYYEKIHTWVLAATFILIAFVICVWVYANFYYYRQSYIKGSVSGLRYQPLEPNNDVDPPLLIEQVAPDSRNVDFYTKSNKDSGSLENGKYTEEWVLSPRAKLTTLVFTFQHRYKIWTSTQPLLIPGSGTVQPRTQGERLEQRFKLDLKSMGYTSATPFELIYKPNREERKLGTICRRTPDGANEVQIPWLEAGDEDSPAATKEKPQGIGSLVPSFFTALASTLAEKPVFRPDGRYDSQVGRTLRQRLGNADLKIQLEARNILVENGSLSFRFIEDSLKLDPEPGYDREILVSNLASAISAIEANKTAIPPRLSLQVAVALYQASEYESAAKFFQKAGDGPIGSDDIYLAYRAYCYLRAGLDNESLKSYEQYLRKATTNVNKATTHANMGYILQRLHRDDEAIEHYRNAIVLDPQLGVSFNNLAYLYSERGTHLNEALSYANRALALEPDNPNFKDTKGWVLLKMNRAAEALPLLKEAATKRPDDKEIQEHLLAAQKVALRLPKKRP
jgi:tetratricopeptide (TPR) repeat protein